jgi:hypothetical protein
VALVNVKFTVPADTPVTTPELVTVATAVLLLTHVPPVVGDKVLVLPTHTEVLPDTLAIGLALTVTVGVGVDAQPVALDVNVNVTVPAATPVTTPAFVTVALAVLLLVQVPLVVGDSVVVFPTHTAVAPVIEAIGLALTVIAGVGVAEHPVVELVNVKVAVPAATPVTTPVFVTVATAVLLLTQVPPVVGDKVEVLLTHIVVLPVMEEVGFAFIVTAGVAFDTQPAVLVKVNVTVPAETPVTTPSLVTVALAVLLLVQEPPVVGESVVVDCAQIDVAPVIATVGLELIVTVGVGLDGHPVAVLVNTNVTVPAATPVTTPIFVTVAKAILLLVQVPPVVGDNVVVVPTHMLALPVIEAVGFAFMVTLGVAFDTHPAVFVKVNVTVPADIPVTTPELATVAMALLLLIQVPPVLGDNVVVASTHIDVAPVMLAAGIALTDIGVLGLEIHPDEVNVNVAVPTDIPVATPALVTVATALLLLVQVPPVAGDKVVVDPIQIEEFPVTLAIGELFTVTVLLGFEAQPLALFV